ncbi:LysM peptidoglycan-binding domain-containing protein [Gordonia alkanivorans]|uniref:LysM peptidoglycan-binding domain-containing protein n=1 Tax=Gordonia alkanivorans TaxID=84096 RepID=UPI00244864C7|nr:LysM peptidoglycan-binding domain-containing protein [Gordonia alkanivorans]MDH3009770.1 LysM peptidoglycan-binding domain-containing protein [Gordonia alkanivorans]
MRTATLIDPVRSTDSVRGDVLERPRPMRRGDGRRPVDGRPVPESAVRVRRVASSRCASPVGMRGRAPVVPVSRVAHTAPSAVIRRRRRTATAILAGVGLALAVWVIAVVGQNYAATVTPSSVGTEVVHVRSGDSLSTIASRVAPEMPREAVVDEIIQLNDLPSSGLRVGQPLLAPRYH